MSKMRIGHSLAEAIMYIFGAGALVCFAAVIIMAVGGFVGALFAYMPNLMWAAICGVIFGGISFYMSLLLEKWGY